MKFSPAKQFILCSITGYGDTSWYPHGQNGRRKCALTGAVGELAEVASWVSPGGAPPLGGFCTSEPVDGSRSFGGGLEAGGRTSRVGSGFPRLPTPLGGVPLTCVLYRPAVSGGRPCLPAWQVSHCLTLRRISESR